MQGSKSSKTSSVIPSFYHQPMPQIEPFRVSTFQAMQGDSILGQTQATQLSFETCNEEFFTLESTPATDYAAYNSPSAASVSSSRSPFSDIHQSCFNTYGSPISESSVVDDDNRLMHAFWVLRNELPGPDFDYDFTNTLTSIVAQPSSFTQYTRTLEMAPQMDVKELLMTCAKTVSEADMGQKVALSAAEALLDELEKKVSITGDPLQRLGAYLLEALRARLLSSGSIIYKKLRCNEPTGPELLTYMQVIYEMCPYYKFAYATSNVIIREAMENENRIHIIDFQLAQGSQWIPFIQAISQRPGGLPSLRITGIDDSDSIHARGGSLDLVGDRLSQVAASHGVPFEFNNAAISGSEVRLERIQIQQGEALAVNFPYILHHMPDESVSTTNHRDRLLRLIKTLSPKVVTLVEQELNTNTATFYHRFHETLDYYTAMFESIDDSGRGRDDRMRINAEEHCVAKDVVNIIACEGDDRVERHEVFGKWQMRLSMAGFEQLGLSEEVRGAVEDVLKDYSTSYGIGEGNGALFSGWKNRALVSVSAWR